MKGITRNHIPNEIIQKRLKQNVQNINQNESSKLFYKNEIFKTSKKKEAVIEIKCFN